MKLPPVEKPKGRVAPTQPDGDSQAGTGGMLGRGSGVQNLAYLQVIVISGGLKTNLY